MSIAQIQLTNFKNHQNRTLTPGEKWNAMTGLNGAGKTNTLDGLYLTCVLKSFLNHSMDACIARHANFFRIEANMTNSDKVILTYPAGGPRKLQLNGKTIQKVGDYIGRHPIMVIQPIDDYRLLEGSQARRRILDQAIAQFNPAYLTALLKYNKLLRQRNALLKQLRQGQRKESGQLSIYNQPMYQCALILQKGREELVEDIKSYCATYYHHISGGRELPDLTYEADMTPEDFLSGLQQNQRLDIAAGRTSCGPHLDDIVMTLDKHPLKNSGSQGQRKSFLLATKLAIYQIMSGVQEKQPILLLDDLFDKLDNERVTNLLSLINGEQFGQVFITDKDDAHVAQIFHQLNYHYEHIKL